MNKSSKIRFIVFIVIHIILYYSAILYEQEYLNILEELDLQYTNDIYIDGSNASALLNLGALVIKIVISMGIFFYSAILFAISIILLVPFRFISIRKSSIVSKLEVSLTSKIVILSPIIVLIILFFINSNNVIPALMISILIFIIENFIYLCGLKLRYSECSIKSEEDVEDYEKIDQ